MLCSVLRSEWSCQWCHGQQSILSEGNSDQLAHSVSEWCRHLLRSIFYPKILLFLTAFAPPLRWQAWAPGQLLLPTATPASLCCQLEVWLVLLTLDLSWSDRKWYLVPLHCLPQGCLTVGHCIESSAWLMQEPWYRRSACSSIYLCSLRIAYSLGTSAELPIADHKTTRLSD